MQKNTDKESRSASVLMQKINKFLQAYGVDELINYLSDYQKDVAIEEYQKYKKIEKISCDVWELPIADLDMSKQGGENKSVRMIITHLTIKHTKINRQQLCLMMKANMRTIKYYLADIKYRIEHKSMYPVFNENLEIIKEKIEFL